MSSSKAAPGGYRNLRAMWENKAADQSTSPPSRGRSPNGSTTSQQEKSPGKVRASFVAVEKAAESNQTQPTVLKSSGSTMDGTNEQTVVEDQNLGGILKGSPFLDEGVFLTGQRKDANSNSAADRAATMMKKIQLGNTEPPPSGDFVDTSAGTPLPKSGPHRLKPKPPVETNKSPSDASKQPATPPGPSIKPRGGVSKIQGVMESAARAKVEREAMAHDAKPAAKVSEPQNIPNDTMEAKKEPPAPTSESVPLNGTGKTQQKSEVDDKASMRRTVAAAQPNAKVANAKTAPTNDSVKSSTTIRSARMSLPTKTANTPMTASTTSSVAKGEETKPTEPRLTEKKAAKASLRVAGTGTTSSLAKKPSRASLNNSEGTKTRNNTKPADEGFLARMMRPTASSAQKTHERIQVSSPPRPRQTSARTLASKPSRRSLSNSDDSKENAMEKSTTLPGSHEGENSTEAAKSQLAGSALS